MEAKKQPFTTPPGFIEALLELISTRMWLLGKRRELSQLFQVCETQDQARIISYILGKFLYIDGDAAEDALKGIAAQICEVWHLTPNNTCVACKDLEGKTDSSAALQQMIKKNMPAYGEWRSNKNFRSNLKDIISDQGINNLVIIDDFSGTGKSLLKTAQWIRDYAASLGRSPVRFYAAFIAVQQSTIDAIDNEIIEDIYYLYQVDRALSDSTTIDVHAAKQLIKEISVNYGGIGKNKILGFDKSEAAFNVQNLNTPNNVFPIFWKYGNNRSPIFPRIEK